MRGVWPYYIGVQASTAAINTKTIYNRAFGSSRSSQTYDREVQNKYGTTTNRLKHNKYKAELESKEYINEESNSKLDSDLNKSKYTKALNTHSDIHRSIYETLKESYKNKKDKYVPGHYKSRNISKIGENYLRELKDKHLLIDIMLRNFDGVKQEISKHNYDERQNENINKIKSWISNVFDYTAAVLKYRPFDKIEQDWEVNQKNYDTLCCLYEIYNHLTFTLMAYLSDKGKPFYEKSDYNDIMIKINQERIGINQYVKSISTKSGMDAICKAFCTISSLNEGEKKHKIEIVPIAKNPCIKNVEKMYYEVEDIAWYFEPSIPCIATGLSSAQYSKDGYYNTYEIIEKIKNNIKDYGKCALVLDTTIQLPENDPASKIINNESIKKLVDEGKLIIFLGKSFQKFATLGTQKMKAGDLTIIGNKDSQLVKSCMETLNAEFDDVFESSKSEFQWMTHLLKYNAKDEIEYLKKCMEGADIVKNIILKMDPLESVGMLLIDAEKHKFLLDKERADNYSIPTNMMSFGFSFCTASDYPRSKTRFTIGLEPEVLLKQLAENKFASPSVVWEPTDNKFSTHMSTYIKHIFQATQYLKKLFTNDGNMREKAKEIVVKQIIKNIKADIHVFSDFQELSEIFQKQEPKIQALEKKKNEKTDSEEFNEKINKILENSPINTECNQQIYDSLKEIADQISSMEKEIKLLEKQTSDENRIKMALEQTKLKEPRSYLVLEKLIVIKSIENYKSDSIKDYKEMLNSISNYNHNDLNELKLVLEKVCKQ